MLAHPSSRSCTCNPRCARQASWWRADRQHNFLERAMWRWRCSSECCWASWMSCSSLLPLSTSTRTQRCPRNCPSSRTPRIPCSSVLSSSPWWRAAGSCTISCSHIQVPVEPGLGSEMRRTRLSHSSRLFAGNIRLHSLDGRPGTMASPKNLTNISMSRNRQIVSRLTLTGARRSHRPADFRKGRTCWKMGRCLSLLSCSTIDRQMSVPDRKSDLATASPPGNCLWNFVSN